MSRQFARAFRLIAFCGTSALACSKISINRTSASEPLPDALTRSSFYQGEVAVSIAAAIPTPNNTGEGGNIPSTTTTSGGGDGDFPSLALKTSTTLLFTRV